jgi:hypothetical protein
LRITALLTKNIEVALPCDGFDDKSMEGSAVTEVGGDGVGLYIEVER